MKPAYWDDARRDARPRDPVLRRLIRRIPGIHLTRRGDPFTTLARAIVGQQISVKAAQTIWQRFVAAVAAAAADGPVAPRSRPRRPACDCPRCAAADCRSARPTTCATSRAISRPGTLDPTEWPALDDEALIERAHRRQGHRPLDRRDVPHLPRAARRRVPGRRHRPAEARSRVHYNDGERLDGRRRCARSPRRGARTAASRRGTCGARSIRFRSSIDGRIAPHQCALERGPDGNDERQSSAISGPASARSGLDLAVRLRGRRRPVHARRSARRRRVPRSWAGRARPGAPIGAKHIRAIAPFSAETGWHWHDMTAHFVHVLRGWIAFRFAGVAARRCRTRGLVALAARRRRAQRCRALRRPRADRDQRAGRVRHLGCRADGRGTGASIELAGSGSGSGPPVQCASDRVDAASLRPTHTGRRPRRARRASASAATAACWRSAATRTASTRSIARTHRPSSRSSTGPSAGPTRRSARSTRSSPSSRRARFLSSPRSRSTARRCTRAPASASRSIRSAAAAHRSSRIARRSNGSAASSGASTPSARSRRFAPAGARHRTFGVAPRDFLLAHAFIPADLLPAWTSIAAQALDGVRRAFERAGDVHRSVCTATAMPAMCCGPTAGPHFVDFDDARMGPAVQDLWMLLSWRSRRDDASARGRARRLRGVRRVRPARAASRRSAAHAAPPPLLGVARARWDDPAFPAAFPWFNTQRYWQDRILELREQVALMDEPPLAV